MVSNKYNTMYWVLILLSVLTTSNAADYYVCDCVDGSDAECTSGQDIAEGSFLNPFQSLNRANETFNSLVAGDSIQFCRGGAWSTSNNLRWVNRSCREDMRCTITDYTPNWASGDELKPLLNFENGVHGFNFSDSASAEHEEGYVLENLDLRGSNGGNGVFLANDIDDVTLINLSITNFIIGVHLGGSQVCNPNDSSCDARNDRIILRDSTITFSYAQGWLGGSNGSQVINNYFSDNGTRAVFDHNIYVSGSSNSVTDGMIISGNQLYRNAPNSDGRCSAVSLVVHGEHNNMMISNNYIKEELGMAIPGCWGIAVDNGYSEAEGFTNITIQNNRIENVGNISIGVGACDTCTIENNIISNNQDFNVRGIAAPDRLLGPEDLPMDNIVIRNNSIYFNNPASGTGIILGTMGNNHVIASNAIYYNGNLDSFNCFDTDLPFSEYLDMDYNLCYHPNAGNAEWSHNQGGLLQWQKASGFSQNASMTNPGFEDPENNQFWAQNQSMAIVNTGHPIFSSDCDYDCTPRDITPDIGAYEWIENDTIFAHGFDE
ncbi:MAG: right-handed parallel beta-helix repeat-containing protein [Marinicellaceae bacterium]